MTITMFSRVTKKGDAVVFLGNPQINLGFAIATTISDDQETLPALYVDSSELARRSLSPAEFVQKHPSVDIQFSIEEDVDGFKTYTIVGLAVV